MEYNVDQILGASLCEFLNYRFLSEAQAYINTTGILQAQNDPKFTNSQYNVYQSPQYQWVADSSSSINNAVVASGININNSFISIGTSGLIVDYLQGRVFITGNPNIVGATCNYSYKNFNIYLGTQFMTQALLNRAENGQQIFINNSYPAPYQFLCPALIITPQTQNNKPWAIGGAQKRQTRFNITIITDNDSNFYAAKSMLTDTLNRNVTILPSNAIPYTYFGALKSPPYSYTGTVSNYSTNSNNLAYITDVRMGAQELFRGKLGTLQNFFVGVGTIDLETYNYFVPA